MSTTCHVITWSWFGKLQHRSRLKIGSVGNWHHKKEFKHQLKKFHTMEQTKRNGSFACLLWCLISFSEKTPDASLRTSSHNHLVKSLKVSPHAFKRHRFDNLDATATQCECMQLQELIYYASSCHVSERGTFTRTGAVLCFLKKNMSNMPGTKNTFITKQSRREKQIFRLKCSEAYARFPSHPPHLPNPSHPHAAQRAHWLVPNDLVCDARYTKHWHTRDEWLI